MIPPPDPPNRIRPLTTGVTVFGAPAPTTLRPAEYEPTIVKTASYERMRAIERENERLRAQVENQAHQIARLHAKVAARDLELAEVYDLHDLVPKVDA